MAIANKAALRDDVAVWLSRVGEADFLARFDSFLALAEADFGPRLLVRQLERRLRANLNEKWEKFPERTIELVSVFILAVDADEGDDREWYRLPYMTHQKALDTYGDTASGEVRAYTTIGEQIGFYPHPRFDQESQRRFQVTAYRRPGPLVLDTDTNDTLSKYPAVYLYGVLKHAAPYYGRQEDLVRWSGLLEQAIDDANVEAAGVTGDIMLARAV